MLIGISSPYRRIGLMYSEAQTFFGIDSDDTLVVHGPTLAFNKTLDPNAIAAQQQADPEAAAAVNGMPSFVLTLPASSMMN